MGKHSIQQAGYSGIVQNEKFTGRRMSQGNIAKEKKELHARLPSFRGKSTMHLVMSYFVYFLGVKRAHMTDYLISADGKMSD